MNAPTTFGTEAINAERIRQITGEDFDTAHDDAHDAAELADAALCYLEHYRKGYDGVPMDWPWENRWWKPSGAIRDLAKAGALIAAEIDRLHRLQTT